MSSQEDQSDDLDLLRDDTSNPETSIDELFATNFSSGGGHFLYCENEEEAFQNLQEIIKYENINSLICLDPDLQKLVEQTKATYAVSTDLSAANFSFLKCEFLCAFDGSIMISAHQTKGRKVEEFPLNFIIWATPDQFANNLSDALQKLKRLKKDNLPTNITCIRGKDMHSFSSIPNAKNIYLLLVDSIS